MIRLMGFLDNFLNKITMYRLVLYGLSALAFLSIIFGFVGWLSFDGMALIYSFFILTLTCYVVNNLLAKLFKVQTNVESAWVTGLILFFILRPISSPNEIKMLVIASVLAMASKYILVIHKKHILNPAAIAVFILGLFGNSLVWWWIGSSIMLLPVAGVGFLILRKIQRFTLFLWFILAAIISILIVGLYNNVNLYDVLTQVFTSWPILFFGSIMLTEPLTTPPSTKLQSFYGALVGVLFGLQFQIGPLYTTPELALIIGNLFSYIVSPRERLVLTLIRKSKLTSDVYEFVWKFDKHYLGDWFCWQCG